ncbi:MAG: hydrogenase expression/formation protein HypE [Granulosicoccus sp.]|nr:hydrogenase expression/formation protein HypE [Granulosicoccus sp.]
MTSNRGEDRPRRNYLRPLDFRHGRIDMNHGGGGRVSTQLIDELFVPAFDNDWLNCGNDAAVLDLHLPEGHRLAMATDAHVISPLEFPGGDIGSLAVHGTINDVVMLGAAPCHLSASFIIEEGFALADLKRIVTSMAAASRQAAVPIVAGDTKVVERGKGDGLFISTTGIGVVPAGRRISGSGARPGDAILLSGTIGDHGVAIMATRESLTFDTTVESDSAALHTLVAELLDALPEGAVRTLRDPTRGGLASTLNEIARQSGIGMQLDETAIPIKTQVAAACELLGLDPLYVANEGKCVIICAADQADRAIAILQAHTLGREAARIGTVTDDPHGFVQMKTGFGGARIVDWMAGEPLPRIC